METEYTHCMVITRGLEGNYDKNKHIWDVSAQLTREVLQLSSTHKSEVKTATTTN